MISNWCEPPLQLELVPKKAGMGTCSCSGLLISSARDFAMLEMISSAQMSSHASGSSRARCGISEAGVDGMGKARGISKALLGLHAKHREM